MKKIFAGVVFLTAFSISAWCQIRSIKGHCGLYYKNMATLYKQQGAALGFYHFQPGQSVASIGAQCCHWEAAFAAASDSLDFWLEDIDSSFFNERQASFAWNYYDSLRGKPMTSKYHLVLGDEKKTNLPEQSFDKMLIINSFHEFSYQKEMLADIRRKLKPGGILYIDEALARKAGDLHGVCKKPIYLSEELIAILKANGFEYVDGLDMQFRKSKPVRKIFAFIAVGDDFKTGKLNDSCNRKRPSLCRTLLIDTEGARVDTIAHSTFDSIVNLIYSRMIKKESLNRDEDKILLRLVNTLTWEDFDEQKDIEKNFPKTIAVAGLFDNYYYSYLRCKYTVCYGRGTGLYYQELKMGYLGTPFDCSRYYVRD